MPIHYDADDGVARITFDDPENRNAVTMGFAEAFARITRQAVTDASTRLIVLGAKGPYFSVGGDITEFLAADQDIRGHLMHITDLIHMAVRHLSQAPVPVLVALNGMAAGGGLSIALSGDMLVAKRSARINSGYTRSGLTPDAGLTWQLPRLVGHARAFEIMALNETLSADDAHQLGIIARVFDDDGFDDEVERIVQRLASMPAGVLGSMKQLMRAGASRALETHLEYEAAAIAQRVTMPETLDILRTYLPKNR